jgi:ATP-dependent protease HslVU (ClpYQ) peptidase subunit
MTCIVAIERDGEVWMGGDSAASRDDDIVRRVNPKVFWNNGFLIGYSGSFRVGQLLQYAFCPPFHAEDQPDMEFLVVEFVDALRQLMKERGTLMKEEEGEAHDAEFIIGYRGKIYVVESDFHVGAPLTPYAACGSGAAYAMGALHAIHKNVELRPQEKIEAALSAAAEFCTGVRSPFTILSSAVDP